MVSSTRTASRLMIIAKPNQSATWRANLMLLVMLAIPSLTIAVAFAWLGAWLILPFAGLELLALGAALYYVNWKLQYRHVITLSDDSVRVDKGHYAPRRSWNFHRHSTGLAITPEKHPWEGPQLCLHDRNESVSLGEFLGREDILQLITLLKQEIRVGSYSSRARQDF